MVGDERDDGLNQPPTPIVYFPILNESYRWRTMAYAVRSSRVGTPGFLRELEQAVWSVNRDLPLSDRANARRDPGALDGADLLHAGDAGDRRAGGVAALAWWDLRSDCLRRLPAYARDWPSHGARRPGGDVRRMFLRNGLTLTAAGIVLGIGVAVVVTRVMSSFLFGVGPLDPVTYVVVSGGLTVIALLATYLPARRASRVDPVIAMRMDV